MSTSGLAGCLAGVVVVFAGAVAGTVFAGAGVAGVCAMTGTTSVPISARDNRLATKRFMHLLRVRAWSAAPPSCPRFDGRRCPTRPGASGAVLGLQREEERKVGSGAARDRESGSHAAGPGSRSRSQPRSE